MSDHTAENDATHKPLNVYEMHDESQEALLRRIEDGTAVLALVLCSACAPEEVIERVEDGTLDLGDGDALAAQWPCAYVFPPGKGEAS